MVYRGYKLLITGNTNLFPNKTAERILLIGYDIPKMGTYNL